MPPKSANRSGKSTPTKLGKSEKDTKKTEEEEQVELEEQERLKKEQEEKERLEKEARERAEAERLETLLSSRREQQTEIVSQMLENVSGYIERQKEEDRMMSKWDRFMRCDGSPDPTVVKQINTYCNLAKDEDNLNINYILQKTNDVIALINELNLLLEMTPEDEILPEVEAQYKETILALQDLIMHRYNIGTLEELKGATYEADAESGNLQKVIKGDNELMMLWANLNKNPRFKSFTFDTEKFTFELPKPLAMAEIAIRVLRTSYDSYSHQSSTFNIKKKKPVEEPVPEEPEVAEGENDEENKETNEEDGEEKEQEEEEKEEEKPPTPNDGRKSSQSVTSGSNKDKDEEKSEADKSGTADNESSAPTENLIADDDELLDEDVIDLRQYSPLGGIYNVELIKLPPQPRSLKGWTLRQIIDEPLTEVEYPSEAFAPKPSSRAQSANEVKEGAEIKPVETVQPPIGFTISLPADVIFSEEPQVARWDTIDLHWKTSGLTDTNYDEDNRLISFKTRHFGTFCLLQDAYLNMPFQSWEIRPIKQNHTLITITAAIAEVEIEVKDSLCSLLKPAEDEQVELSHLYGSWMPPSELISAMKRAGVNVFPADDAEKFVSINDKVMDIGRLYEMLGLLCTSFAFQWSKWNTTCEKDKVVMQVAPWMGVNSARPGSDKRETPVVYEAPPPNLVDDDWALYVVGDERCHKLATEEYDDEFSIKPPGDAEIHVDLYHALTNTSFKTKSPPAHCSINPYATTEKCIERVNTIDRNFAYAVQTILKASKFISFS